MEHVTIDNEVIASDMLTIAKYAEDTFPRVRSLLERNDPGYVLTLRYGLEVHCVQRQFVVAKPEAEKIKSYRRNSFEKIWRARANEHLTSFESMDISLRQYPGGIVLLPWCAAISGCAGIDDHCLIIATMVRCGHLKPQAAYDDYIGAGHFARYEKFLNALPNA